MALMFFLYGRYDNYEERYPSLIIYNTKTLLVLWALFRYTMPLQILLYWMIRIQLVDHRFGMWIDFRNCLRLCNELHRFWCASEKSGRYNEGAHPFQDARNNLQHTF